MQDYLIRATALGGSVRAFAVQTTGIVEELRRRHDTFPLATAALGRTVSAGVMMGAMLKDEQRLTIQVKGNGPLGQIVVDADAKGNVRGYIDNPHVDLPLNERGKLDVAGGVGEGYLYIIKDLGLKEPYRGSVPLVSGELAEDFTYYFAKSEQTPSSVALGVLVSPDYSVQASGGFILQLLPGLDDDEIDEMEKNLARLPPVTSLLASGEDMESILKRIIDSVEVLEKSEIRFQCQCSRERVERTLISLGREEIQDMIREDGKAELVCHFCNEAYQYSREQLQELLDHMNR
jgi:molecular chaperone Hsp33